MSAVWLTVAIVLLAVAGGGVWFLRRRRRPSIVPTAGAGGRLTYRVRSLAIGETWMDDAIARAGGYRVAARHSIPPKVKNCDYRIDGLLIELKILEHDVFETPSRQDKIIKFFEDAGYLTEAGLTTIASDELSSELQKKYWSIALSGVESIVKKANKQIRETAQLLDMTEFRGALLLVNKECESIETHSLKRYVEWLIKKENYSSLHYVLCFSAIPAISGSSRPAIGFYTSQPPEPAIQDAFDRLVEACRVKVQELLGKKLDDAPAGLADFQNLRDDRHFVRGDTTVTLASNSKETAVKHHGEMRDRTRE